MSTDLNVASRYAMAVLNIARRRNEREAVLEEAKELFKLFTPGSRFAVFLEGPHIPTETKLGVIRRSFEERANPLFVRLFETLVTKGRGDYVAPVLLSVRDLIEHDLGLREATVETAIELDDAKKQSLQAQLERYTQSRLRIEWKVDDSLIAGVRFRCGDIYMDDSIRGKLDNLGRTLRAAATRVAAA